MRADAIKIEMVRIYMDKRGERSINQANQELGGMSRIFGWGFERGYVKGNPCKGVRKFTLKPREVYVTDEEYQAIYDAAAPALKVGMEIAYLCAARLSDVLSLKWEQMWEDGIFIQQGKTGKNKLKPGPKDCYMRVHSQNLWRARFMSYVAVKEKNIRRVVLVICGKKLAQLHQRT
jgi:integrase